MPTFTTVFRASVMLIATIIVVKGWQIYGPSTTWLKTVAARALELAQDSLAEPRSVEKTGLAVVAAENAPAFSATPPSLEAVGPTIAAPPVFPTGDGEAVPAVLPQPVSMAAPVMDPSDGRSSVSESAVDRMPLLMNRLSKLGAVNSQLAPWGSSGQLYRFCCSAAVAKAPNLLRHFESVAVEPLAAVEEVLAKVEAWRTAEEGGNQLK